MKLVYNDATYKTIETSYILYVV